MNRFALSTMLMAFALFASPASSQSTPAVEDRLAAGEQAFAQHDDATAVAIWESLIAVMRADPSKSRTSLFLLKLGIAEERLGRNAEALQYLTESLTLARQAADRRMEAAPLLFIGKTLNRLHRHDEALRSASEALDIHRALGDRTGESADLVMIAEAEDGLSRPQDALKSYRDALAVLEALKQPAAQAETLVSIAGIQIAVGDMGGAERSIAAALVASGQGSTSGEEANVLRGIGLLESRLGHYAGALRYYERALQLYRRAGDRNGEAVALHDVGVENRKLGRFADATKTLQLALALYRNLHDRRGESAVLHDLGAAQEDQERYADALASAQAALSLHQAEGDRFGTADDLHSIGTILSLMGKKEEAITYLTQALEIHRASPRNSGVADDLLGVAIAEIDVGRFNDARSHAREAAALHRRVGDREGLWRSLRAAAVAAAALNDFGTTISDYDEALDVLESLRLGVGREVRSSFISTNSVLYDNYIAGLYTISVELRKPEYQPKALEVLLRKQARTVLEVVAAGSARRYRGVPNQLVEEERRTQDALENAERRLDRSDELSASALLNARASLDHALADRAALDDRVSREYPSYFALMHPQRISSVELQRALRPDEAMLLYNVGFGKGHIFVATRDRVVAAVIPNAAPLQRSVDTFRQHIVHLQHARSSVALDRDAAADLPGFLNDSFALYRSVVPDEVAPLLAGKRLIVVPSGPLYEIPFEALATNPSAESARFLIEDHAISYVPAGSLLELLRRTPPSRRPRKPLLAFADPSFGAPKGGLPVAPPGLARALRTPDGRYFAALPGTRAEADAVRDALGAPSSSVVSAENATKSRILRLNSSQELADFRYILFATHAVLTPDPGGSEQPALVFAHPEQDGFLTVSDVFGLTLDADFVALSACSTGEGTREPTEGITGLTRAFLYAGTPALSVTLWDVDDAAAPLITPRFFGEMARGVSPADALRDAKLAMLRGSGPARFRHPYAWAPSVIFGDGDTAR